MTRLEALSLGLGPRRASALAAVLALSSLFTGVARAEDASGEVRRARLTDTSPQHAAFELRFGPYRPKIDDNTGAPVYSEFFGDGRRFMFGFEGDWQALRVPYLGSIGIGIGAGYTFMSAKNQVPPGVSASGEIAQESTLNILPVYAVGVLRIDTLARNYNVPLVPYGKLGVAHAFWWINDGVGTATSDDGTKGRDTSTGIQAAIGGMFLLDILEPSAARAADNDAGVNNSYLFFEWAMSDYGGDQMNVGSNTWVTGLAFEM